METKKQRITKLLDDRMGIGLACKDGRCFHYHPYGVHIVKQNDFQIMLTIYTIYGEVLKTTVDLSAAHELNGTTFSNIGYAQNQRDVWKLYSEILDIIREVKVFMPIAPNTAANKPS